MSSYKEAHEHVMNTGSDIDVNQYDSFMEYMHNTYCKWYSKLHTVLGSRRNVWPAYTNEDDDLNTQQNNNYTTTKDNSTESGKDYANAIITRDLSDSSICDDNKNSHSINSSSTPSAGLDISNITNENTTCSAKYNQYDTSSQDEATSSSKEKNTNKNSKGDRSRYKLSTKSSGGRISNSPSRKVNMSRKKKRILIVMMIVVVMKWEAKKQR